MTDRERFHEMMSFGDPDRPPYHEMGAWPEAYDRWYEEGYPKRADYHTYFGFDGFEQLGVETDILPVFKEEIIEETDNHIIKIDWRGVKVKLVKGSRCIPYFYGFPVHDRESFRNFKKRLDPTSPSRYPILWDKHLEKLKNRDYPVFIGTGRTFGFFGPIREWMGVEKLCMTFYDDPGWVHEMMDFYADFIIELTKPFLEQVTPDWIQFFEDMAYRGGSMISPKLFREFMIKPYQRVLDHFRKYNVPFFMIDCDGQVNELVPLFIELGIHGMYPFEVQAGMDILKVRSEYGKNLVIWGGLDKRKLFYSKKEIDEELEAKLPKMLELGGYVPMMDHDPPPDISFENMCYFRKRIRDICE